MKRFFFCGRICDLSERVHDAILEVPQGKKLVQFFNLPSSLEKSRQFVDEDKIYPYNANFKNSRLCGDIHEWDEGFLANLFKVVYD